MHSALPPDKLADRLNAWFLVAQIRPTCRLLLRDQRCHAAYSVRVFDECVLDGQVVESTGLVMAPYIEYPQLLGVLLRMLNEGEGSQHVRREVLKVSSMPTQKAA